MKREFKIGNRIIGSGRPVYVSAELSANHGHDFELAAKTVQAMKEAGADAVKVQTYTADTLTIDSEAECFRIGGGTLWDGRTLHSLYKEAAMPWEWQPRLKEIANGLGMDFFSTPFDESAVEFLEVLGVPAYKVASFELVDLPLLERVARTGKPVILSTGMASLTEIEEAVRVIGGAGSGELALLKCTSAYPASPADMNLKTIGDLAARFQIPIGLSDHTMGQAVPVAAVAMGACIVEKHFTLSRQYKGPDASFSLEPDEFRSMVAAVRTTEQAIGSVSYETSSDERKSRAFRRSLFVVEDVRAGETFTARNVRSIRPAYGLHPRHLVEIVGKRAATNIRRGTPLSWDLLLER